MTLVIAPVTGPEDGRAAVGLIRDFFDWLAGRYPELEALIAEYFEKQGIEAELDALSEGRTHPGGLCLLARLNGAPAGLLMMKPVTDSLCEMNRMYVADSARGHGVARALAARLFDEARKSGFTEMRLEALDAHHEALPLYLSLGFSDDPDPTEFALSNPRVVSMRRAL